MAVAGVDRGGALVDAHDGADLVLQVPILEGDLLATAQVIAPGLGRCCRCCRRRRVGGDTVTGLRWLAFVDPSGGHEHVACVDEGKVARSQRLQNSIDLRRVLPPGAEGRAADDVRTGTSASP